MSLALFAIAVSLDGFVWLALLHAMPMVSDAADYLAGAREMATHYPQWWGASPFYLPPGTSMAIALLCGPFEVTTLSARLLTIAVSGLTVVAIRALAKCLTTEPRSIRAATVFALLYPPAVLVSGQSYSQAYAQLWLVLLALVLLNAWRTRCATLFFLAGAVFGIGTLTRPSMQSLWPVLAGAIAFAAWRGRGHAPGWTLPSLSRAAMAFIAAFSLVAVPVLYGNHLRGGGFTFSTNNERNFFLGNNPYTPHYKTAHLAQRPVEAFEPEVRRYLKSIYESPNRQQKMMDEAIAYIRENPGTTMWRTSNRIRAYWGFDYMMSRQAASFYSLGSVAALSLLAVEAGGYFLLMVAVIIGLFHGWPWLVASRAAFVIALALAYQVPYAIAFSSGTYHFPVVGLLIPFAGAGAQFISTPGAPARISRWAWACIAAFLLFQVEYAFHLLEFASPGP